MDRRGRRRHSLSSQLSRTVGQASQGLPRSLTPVLPISRRHANFTPPNCRVFVAGCGQCGGGRISSPDSEEKVVAGEDLRCVAGSLQASAFDTNVLTQFLAWILKLQVPEY